MPAVVVLCFATKYKPSIRLINLEAFEANLRPYGSHYSDPSKYENSTYRFHRFQQTRFRTLTIRLLSITHVYFMNPQGFT